MTEQERQYIMELYWSINYTIHPLLMIIQLQYGKEFDIEKGCLIDGEYIQPGEEPNCGCTSEAIIPGLGTIGHYE